MKPHVLAIAVLAATLPSLVLPAGATVQYDMAVEIWTDRGEDFVYLPGDPLRVYFRAPEDCYVVLYQIDTYGNVCLLFPSPTSNAFFARAGVVYCVNDFLPEGVLTVYGTSGVGYIGVLASPVPFLVPRWIRPHPAYRAASVVYIPGYYPAVVVEPYLAICDLNERIVADWGIGLRLGFGYCWFYVDHCYVPVFPIWHPRYWEVRIVTRPVYERVWRHHDRFYRLPPAGVRHNGQRRFGLERLARRPFERPRTFRASPHPEPPAWVRAVERHSERRGHDEPESREARGWTRVARPTPAGQSEGRTRAPQSQYGDLPAGPATYSDAERRPSPRSAREPAGISPSHTPKLENPAPRETIGRRNRISFSREAGSGSKAYRTESAVRQRPQAREREMRVPPPRQESRDFRVLQSKSSRERMWTGTQRDGKVRTRTSRT